MRSATGGESDREEGGNQQGSNRNSKDDAMILAIYDKVVTSVCMSVASQMHRLVKRGEIPHADLVIPDDDHRRDVYPELYSSFSLLEKSKTAVAATEDCVLKRLEGYAAEKTAKRPRLSTRAHKAYIKGQDDNDTENSNAAGAGMSTMNTRQNSVCVADVWGKFPPKEPPDQVECPICHRSVSTLRFAPHLVSILSKLFFACRRIFSIVRG